MRFRWVCLLGLACLLAAPLARAQLSIEITGGGEQRTPIAIVPFAGEAALDPGLSAIVRADLERSGQFRGLELPPLVPHPTESSPVNYAEWRSRLADALVLGSVATRPDGRFEVRFRLFDVVKQAPLGGIAYTLSRDQVRAAVEAAAAQQLEVVVGPGRRRGDLGALDLTHVRRLHFLLFPLLKSIATKVCNRLHGNLPRKRTTHNLSNRSIPQAGRLAEVSEETSGVRPGDHVGRLLSKFSLFDRTAELSSQSMGTRS